MSTYVYASPVGPLTLTGEDAALTGLWFPGRGPAAPTHPDPAPFTAAIAQLDAYFRGELTTFDLPLAPGGSAFRRQVWDALTEIPYGETISYGALAGRLEDVRGEWVSPRAVGAANGANPISIIVPCHRVIGADGSLTGYGGGLQRKQALLELESAHRDGGPAPAVWAGRQTSLL
ncbi:MAG TPA: methylated-DNA--[protein]-cysteine S-methyltransferase [Solirubrobacteraceae bacterium]|nr:methylated-DNA--[protein]-cysteine S-methyltransferase [Solirubrobacteraceae bacterium]